MIIFIKVYFHSKITKLFVTLKITRNSIKKTENVNLLILGSRTDTGFITTLNKMLWSATGASKPMEVTFLFNGFPDNCKKAMTTVF
jgi:hypothetical protein